MITISNLGKCYRIYKNPFLRVWETLWREKYHRDIWALQNVYLSINQGACFGIIGPNGAGKSTFLKLLSGITRPTEGSVQVDGKVASILELGTGFHPDFSGRSNVYLNCALQGIRREETDELLPGILAFSELEEYIDLPVRMYSTGMYLRLAFSVATAIDPDVLIVDEALAVGDEHFRNKCMNRMNEFKERGKTILMVSHDLATVRHFCTNVALFDKGKMIDCGRPDEIMAHYLAMVHRDKTESSPQAVQVEDNPRWGSGEVCTKFLTMHNEAGEESYVFDTNQRVMVEGLYEILKPVKGVVFGYLIYRSDGTYVHGSNHFWHKKPTSHDFEKAGEKVKVHCEYPALPLLPGEYYITVTCYNKFDGFPQAVDHWERACTFTVSQRYTDQHGIFYMDSDWTLERNSNAPNRLSQQIHEKH